MVELRILKERYAKNHLNMDYSSIAAGRMEQGIY